MVECNKGFQDKMFALYTGRSLKQVCTKNDYWHSVPYRVGSVAYWADAGAVS